MPQKSIRHLLFRCLPELTAVLIGIYLSRHLINSDPKPANIRWSVTRQSSRSTMQSKTSQWNKQGSEEVRDLKLSRPWQSCLETFSVPERETLPDISHTPVIALALVIVIFSIKDYWDVIPAGLTTLCSFEIGTEQRYKSFTLICCKHCWTLRGISPKCETWNQ